MKRSFRLLTLVAINVAAIGSLNNLSSVALVGLSGIAYYLIIALCFLIPYTLVTAELSSAYTTHNGVYIWVRDAFGPLWGFVAGWLLWIENIFWYPTILSFTADTLIQLIAPSLASNKIYNLCATLGIYWSLTLINLLGVRISSVISLVGTIIGILIPNVLLIICAFLYTLHHPPAMHLHSTTWIPTLNDAHNLAFLVGIALSFAGLEMSSAYTRYVQHPKRTIPLATVLSAIIVLSLAILGSLAIAALVPNQHININEGVSQAFRVYFEYAHVSPIAQKLLFILIFLGGLTAISTWILGIVSNLVFAAEDGRIPTWLLDKRDPENASPAMLLFQAVFVTLFCSLFVIMPTINSAYWMLTAISGQFYLLLYVMLFLAAIALRKQKTLSYEYEIATPFLTYVLSSWGILGCVVLIGLGFLLPNKLAIINPIQHHSLHLGLFLTLLLAPFLIYYFYQRLRFPRVNPNTLVLEELESGRDGRI